MHTEHLFQPFGIEVVASGDCPLKTHKHSYFELVYIVSGEGTHNVNGNVFPYMANNLFLLRPMDTHYFVVKEFTSFLFIRFNNIYLQGQMVKDERNPLGQWIHKLEYIFENNHSNGCIIQNLHDKPLARAVIEALLKEYAEGQLLQKELVQQLINTLITLVARNISGDYMDKRTDNTALRIINYIHQNIYDPSKLKAEHLAAHFNISLHYVGEYFKKEAGENLQQYIIHYKLSLVEARLRHSDMRLNEIADELGFTDESHLTKTFKKYKGITPTQFRKNIQGIAAA
ncbi:MAG: helix-turn-helix domain-containing protein [Chitinophagaceae bacterium]|nr:helix-turn-helix domain-containing protein [Chitinophagaceae bacterium]